MDSYIIIIGCIINNSKYAYPDLDVDPPKSKQGLTYFE